MAARLDGKHFNWKWKLQSGLHLIIWRI